MFLRVLLCLKRTEICDTIDKTDMTDLYKSNRSCCFVPVAIRPGRFKCNIPYLLAWILEHAYMDL